MKQEVDRTGYLKRFGEVVCNELEFFVGAQGGDIDLAAREEIIHAHHGMSIIKEMLTQM